jgi:hypothetical protein
MKDLQAVQARPQPASAGARTATGDLVQKLVPISDLLTPGFVKRHSRFQNVEQFLSASGLSPCTLADLDPNGRQRWDDFTRLSTKFPAWDAMLREARGEWVMRRMGIIIDA